MRIVVSILVFLAGCGCIAYSFIGSLVTLAGGVEKSMDEGDGLSAIGQVFEFVLRGEIPQLTGFLYVGLLFIAIAITNLIVRPNSDDARD